MRPASCVLRHPDLPGQQFLHQSLLLALQRLGRGLQFADFADAVSNDRPPAVDGEEGRKTVALFQAIYRSGREGRPVRP